MDSIRQRIIDAQMAAQSLVIYRSILKDPIVETFMQILDLALGEASFQELVTKYHDFFSRLVSQSENRSEPAFGNLWQDHILNLVIGDENPFSLRCEKTGI
ncbi:MAG: ATP-binding protein, partial [Tepidanaerobacteraceae bacterium]